MTIIQAIIKVMREAGCPLTPGEAYERIVERGLYEFRAQNPKGVVAAQIRRHCKGLEFPTAETKKYFELQPDGKFAALSKPLRTGPPGRRKATHTAPRESKSPPRSLASALADLRNLQSTYRTLLKERILRDLKTLTPEGFEHFSRRLLEVYGFEDMDVTTIGKDGGIDGHGKLRVGVAHMRVAFQCKKWTKSNVGRPEIDRFRGAIQGQYEQGIFFTTASFVPAAKEASLRPGAVPIILVDGPGVVDLMLEKQFGVQDEGLTIPTYALDTILGDAHDESGG